MIKNKYYVYTHSYGNEIFYVGYGSFNRAWSFPEKGKIGTRNDEWWKFCKEDLDNIEVEIIKYFDDKKEAYTYESYYTQKLFDEGHPLVNKAIGHKIIGKYNGQYGKPSSFKGRKHTEEAKKKIGDRTRGKNITQQHKDRISETRRMHYVEGLDSPIIAKNIDDDIIEVYKNIESAAKAHGYNYSNFRYYIKNTYFFDGEYEFLKMKESDFKAMFDIDILQDLNVLVRTHTGDNNGMTNANDCESCVI